MTRRILTSAALLAILSAGLPSNALAQYERTWVDINLGANRVPQEKYVTAGEIPAILGQATLGADYVFPQGWTADIGGGHMMSPRFGIGGTVLGSRNRHFPRLAVSIANASDLVDALTPIDRFDIAVHLHAMYDLMPESDRFRARVFAGPSYFHVIHETVDTIAYSPLLPSSSVRITSFTFSESDGGAWGVHAGGDVSYFFGPNIGLGAFLRVSRGSVRLEDFSGTFTVKAGGIQSGGGLRLRF